MLVVNYFILLYLCSDLVRWLFMINYFIIHTCLFLPFPSKFYDLFIVYLMSSSHAHSNMHVCYIFLWLLYIVMLREINERVSIGSVYIICRVLLACHPIAQSTHLFHTPPPHTYSHVLFPWAFQRARTCF